MIGFGNEARDLREPVRAPSPAPAATPSHAPTQRQEAPSATAQSKVAVLGPTLRFKGELSAEEDFILQGSLEGSISNPQCVTIGTDGSVVGDIRARVITVDGQVEGDLHGGESVVVHQTGRVSGNIFAPRVGIVEGAFFNGRIEMTQRTAAQPAAKTQSHSAASQQSTPSQKVPSQMPPGASLTPEETEKVLSKK